MKQEDKSSVIKELKYNISKLKKEINEKEKIFIQLLGELDKINGTEEELDFDVE